MAFGPEKFSGLPRNKSQASRLNGAMQARETTAEATHCFHVCQLNAEILK